MSETNHNLVARVFPRLRPFTCVDFEFSLAPCDVYLCSEYFGFGFTTLNQKALQEYTCESLNCPNVVLLF